MAARIIALYACKIAWGLSPWVAREAVAGQLRVSVEYVNLILREV